jgi:hypothetical protein
MECTTVAHLHVWVLNDKAPVIIDALKQDLQTGTQTGKQTGKQTCEGYGNASG